MESSHIFQEMLFVDVQAVTQMLTKYNSIIQSLSEPEVSIKLKAIRVGSQRATKKQYTRHGIP